MDYIKRCKIYVVHSVHIGYIGTTLWPCAFYVQRATHKDKAVKTWGSPGVNLVTGLYRLIKWFGKKENHENKKTDNIVCKASSFVGNSFLFRL